MPPGSLQGASVLLTRPVAQATRLAQALQQRGAQVLPCPLLEIIPSCSPSTQHALSHQHYDCLIFISANAVQQAQPWLRIAATTRLAAIGPATARAIQHCGWPLAIQAPAPHTSEALLAEPALQQVAGWRIGLVCGRGGRDLLAQTLSARGAQLERLEVYYRQMPPMERIDQTQLVALAHAQQPSVIASSPEILRNLFALAEQSGQQWLRTIPLVVVSERAQILAEQQGWQGPILLAEAASDEAIVAVLEHRHRLQQQSFGEPR